jgi:tRNA1Val (adenine37-N6)-methyltransferase
MALLWFKSGFIATFVVVMAREKVFKFKRFAVLNDKTAMKVGTDGVLLGAWCDVENASRVLDVGTGCGLIALMVAQRNSQAMIHGIDIDANAIDEARFNFNASPWGARLSAEVADFNSFSVGSYDLIVSNPPFFTNGVLPPSDSRTHARHTTTLTYESLLSHCRKLLTPGGRIAIVTPADVELAVRRCVVEQGLGLSRFTRVVPVDGAPVKRLLWELVVGDVDTMVSTLTISGKDRSYTNEYRELTCDFYLD